MSDISVKKTIIDGLNRHRSHATALPSTGMTYLLKPALTIVKASLPSHSASRACQSPAAYVIPTGACAIEGIYRQRDVKIRIYALRYIKHNLDYCTALEAID